MKRAYTPFDRMVTVYDLRECTNFRQAVDLAVQMNGTTFKAVAEQMDYSYAQFLNVIGGRQDLRPKMCFALEKILNIEAKYWWNLWWDTYCKK